MRTRILNLKDVVRNYDIEPLEVFNGLFATVWGLWLLLPFNTFAINQGFDFMRSIAPEWVWGTILASAGIVQLTSVATLRDSFIRVSAIGSACLWTFLAVGITLGNWRSSGGAILGLHAATQAYVAMRT